jgi:hypothetical protein
VLRTGLFHGPAADFQQSHHRFLDRVNRGAMDGTRRVTRELGLVSGRVEESAQRLGFDGGPGAGAAVRTRSGLYFTQCFEQVQKLFVKRICVSLGVPAFFGS